MPHIFVAKCKIYIKSYNTTESKTTKHQSMKHVKKSNNNTSKILLLLLNLLLIVI